MKHKLSLFTTAAVLTAASQAGAQGYLSIGANADSDFERKLPFSWTVGAQLGWDSNVGVTSSNEQESAYISASIGIDYSSGDRRTAISYHGSYSPLWYFDAPDGVDEFQNNARFGMDYRRRINPKLVLTNSFYVSYEVEPDYQIGATVARRTEPYFYGYESLAAAYSWNRRFSTVTSFTVSGVYYDGGYGENYANYMLANEFRYAFSRTTTGTFTYRFGLTDYEDSDDTESHFILIGADHRFSPRLSGSIRTGVELRESESTPYVETSLTYRVSRKTDVRWYSVYGYPIDSGSSDADLRTGVTASHRFNSRFSGNLGAHYIGENSDFMDQETLALSTGFNYILYKNVSLNGGYSFTTSATDAPNGIGEYDRHMVQLGIASRF